jgi:AraC-like DNA-binding protein
VSYRELPASARLARYVECYWWSEETTGDRHQSVLPDGCVDILFSTIQSEPKGLSAVGLMTTPLVTETTAGQRYFGVRFRPGMAAAFIRPAAELNDRTEPLENIWGAAARQLNQRLADLTAADDMAQVVETFLRPADPPDAAQRALWRVGEAGVSLDDLASDSGLSTRNFRRVCLERAGVSPKYLQRILRFRAAVSMIHSLANRGAQPSWAQLASACGYYDQAHLIREFQQFAGSTPGRFLQSGSAPAALESGNDEPNETRKSDRLR